MAISKHSVPKLVAATLLAASMVAVSPAVAQGPRNAAEFAEWCRSQGLSVASWNPPRCGAASASPASGSPSGGRPWWAPRPRHERLQRQQQREEQRQQQQLELQRQRELYRSIAEYPRQRAMTHCGLAMQTDPLTVIRGCTALIQSQRDDAQHMAVFHNNRGISHYQRRDFAGALADYNQAIRLNAQLAAAFNNRGTLRAAQGDYPGALADYDQAIRLDPHGATFYANRGIAHRDHRDYLRALADYDEALRLSTNHPSFRVGRGAIFSRQGDHARALAEYDEALRSYPDDPVARGNRAVTAARLNAPRPASTDGVQTNPGALTPEGRAVAAGPPAQGLVRAETALEQATIAGTGGALTGRVFDGGTGPSDATATGAIVSPPIPTPVHATRVLSPADVVRYSGDPIYGDEFRRLDARVQEYRALLEQWETSRSNLARQRRPTREIERASFDNSVRIADEAAGTVRDSRDTAVREREEIINLSINQTVRAPPALLTVTRLAPGQ